MNKKIRNKEVKLSIEIGFYQKILNILVLPA